MGWPPCLTAIRIYKRLKVMNYVAIFLEFWVFSRDWIVGQNAPKLIVSVKKVFIGFTTFTSRRLCHVGRAYGRRSFHCLNHILYEKTFTMNGSLVSYFLSFFIYWNLNPFFQYAGNYEADIFLSAFSFGIMWHWSCFVSLGNVFSHAFAPDEYCGWECRLLNTVMDRLL